MISSIIPVNYKAVTGYEIVTPSQTKIYVDSALTGKRFAITLAVDVNQLMKWTNGMPIQRALPNISKDVAEVLCTGILDKEFKKLMSDL